VLFGERSYVFTQDRDSSQREGRRRSGLAGLTFAAKRDCPSSYTYGAGMECQDTPASQDKPHDRPQEIGRQILIRERRQTASPKAFRNTIHEEAGLIPIGKLEELSRSVRSKGERRGVSFDFPEPRVL
jgi:hypothetical protein